MASLIANRMDNVRSVGCKELSDILCWTRMQAEAGQPIEAIVSRKELERQAGDGLFCWGIGNAPPRSLPTVLRDGQEIDVVFSLMKSRPKSSDVAPAKVVAWRSYIDLDGSEKALPPHILVTSSAKSGSRSHYALICQTESPLELADLGMFDPSAYRNVSDSSRPVGASQVTALLRKVSSRHEPSGYRINLRASLVRACWVKLGNPIELTSRKKSELAEMLDSISEMSATDWMRSVLGLRSERRIGKRAWGEQLALFAH